MTLIEVLVAMSVSSLVMLLLGGLFLVARDMDRRTQVSRGFEEISIAMESLTAELRQTSRHPGAVLVWDADASGLSPRIVAILSARVPTAGQTAGRAVESGPRWTGWTYFVFDPARSELRRLEFPGAPATVPSFDGGRVLAKNVRGFDVARHNGLFAITLVAAHAEQTLRLQTEVWPRNE